jgi:hypothetical protein
MTFFSEVHETSPKVIIFSDIKYLICLSEDSRYKKVEITPYFLSDHNGRQLELNRKRNYRKNSNI